MTSKDAEKKQMRKQLKKSKKNPYYSQGWRCMWKLCWTSTGRNSQDIKWKKKYNKNYAGQVLEELLHLLNVLWQEVSGVIKHINQSKH